ncbi:formate dehydrogenase subunit gamma [Roseibium sp. CAU 1637]|uniref:Formate dehydrogenase subunit gamma n=1 Tax=Roseibium limicola TaxID=2816037 RepID=A0A939ELZ4_9HYPH|nr:formate dehydrogenase subunit gamma [Roseibium limicola]MBO0345041.1 formate dehydrogenase subunit gamma [Roseibium limicola]
MQAASAHMTRTLLRRLAVALVFGVLLLAGAELGTSDAFAQSSVRTGEEASSISPVDGQVPGNALGETSQADYWRAVRSGTQGFVSIPDKKAGTLIQSEGEAWRSFRNGPLSLYASWAILATIIGLCLFYALRGRIRIEHGKSDQTITRFAWIERFGHWMTAISFVVLGLSGLNVLYGRYVFPALIGDSAFGFLTQIGKYLHNYLAFAFMGGLVMIFVMWVRHNLPDRTDIKWILQAGGMFSKNLHPPAKKFNAGQKLIFWSVMLGGLSLSLSGWALLFPFTTHFFGDTFDKINWLFGTELPTALTVLQEQQINQLWHAIMAIFMVCVILAHIYIGTLGMEGAFDAMGSGEVDLNWAKEHHALWVDEELEKESRRERGSSAAQPAE